MKRLYFILLVAGCFISCQEKVQEQKFVGNIASIYYESSLQPMSLKETWTWKDSLPSVIEYYNNDLIFSKLQYEYQGTQVSEININDDEATAKFTYNGSQLSNITYSYADGTIYKSIDFSYQNEKIASIKTIEDSTHYSEVQIEWQGNNIYKESYKTLEDSIESTFSYTYSYDDKINPYQNIFQTNMKWYEVFSENNVIQETITDDNNSSVSKYSYTYQETFPIQKSYTNGNFSYTYYFVYR